MTIRQISRVIDSVATSDGAGVKLRRSLGSSATARVDPFLMLDEFYSDNPDDYLAGFPAHPHRGFETVTYILDGHMLHEDNFGNRGELQAGGVQWMTAGRGIVHSEMPQQSEGRMRGFQLWLNLPAQDKMQPATYRDIPAEQIPRRAFSGGHIRLIAGELSVDGQSVTGPAASPVTQPIYADVMLESDARIDQPLPESHAALIYVYEGSLSDGQTPVAVNQAAVLGAGDAVALQAGGQGARFLLLAAVPLNEPVVQYGPFVMNSRAEIEQAMRDYQAGHFGHAAAG
ncbi:MAG: quercetin 2,3-dioxygenase [Salinisphaeraceae bacterium]|nr:quercetin 2,3-dioxygenase [Salinisphaeraceae bacterium]